MAPDKPVSLALAGFFFFSIEGIGGIALAALCLALVAALFARGQSGRWRAARALAVAAMTRGAPGRMEER